MQSISDALAARPRPSWHQSVAVVQELAALLSPGQPVPAPDDLLLDADGSLTFGFAGESKRPQVADLGALLVALLDGVDAPAPLRDLAAENACDPPAHSTLEGFSRALAFFERPNRKSDLQALGSRLSAVQQGPEQVLRDLRQRVSSDEASATRKSTEAREPRPARWTWRVSRRSAIVAAGAAALLVAIVLVAAAFRTRDPRPPVVASDEHAAADGDRAAPPETAGTRGERPHGEGVSTSRSPAKSDDRARRVRAEGPAGQATGRQVGRTFTPGSAHLSLVPAIPRHDVGRTDPDGSEVDLVVASRGGPIANGPEALYSAADAAVAPPVLLRQQLPSQPSPDARTGYFEITVDTGGSVESVRLISPTHRYEERMLVAAAKAWKFAPARIDGHPVRYRLRVPVTVPASE